jgi:hypothetical protein
MADHHRLLADLRSMSASDDAPWGDMALTLDHALREVPGHKLFTILQIDWDRNENQRIYSSAADSYPCGQAKPLTPASEFYQEVILGGRARLCADREACRRAFADHALIEALGCESAVNVPIRQKGVTVGSLNLLHRRGWYRPEMLAPLMLFADFAAAILTRRSFGPPP